MSISAADEIRIRKLERFVGQPNSDQSKSLFDIVASLNKEIVELRLKIEDMENGGKS